MQSVFVVFIYCTGKKEIDCVVPANKVTDWLVTHAGKWATIHQKDNGDLLQVTIPYPSKENPTLLYEAVHTTLKE